MSKLVHSHSALELFELCPRKFEGERITKEFPYVENEKSMWGKEAHKALEKNTLYGQPLDHRFESLQWVVDRFGKLPGIKLAETRMGVTKDIQPCGFFDEGVYYRGQGDFIADNGRKVFCADYKGLPLDTLIPTPKGFVKNGDLVIGDVVFDIRGEACNVVGKSEVHNKVCYKIRFDDKSEVVCDEDHVWVIHGKGCLEARELKKNHSIVLANPVVDMPAKDLPLDPYLLGVWLADGKHTSSEITKPDQDIWDEIQRRGYSISLNYSETAQNDKCRVHTVYGIRGILNDIGVLGNKHIPQEYLWASYRQRLDLLRGLMDGDGSRNDTRNQCVFSSTNLALSKQVKQLLCSLGQRPLLNTAKAFGFGIETTVYPVTFRPQHELNPFLLPRKAARVDEWGRGDSWKRRITSVEICETVPTQCIAVDSVDNTYLCTEQFIPTHNTGKKKSGGLDLERMALLVFAHFPQCEEVLTAFIWLQNKGSFTPATYKRSEVDRIWSKIVEEATTIEWACENNRFPPRENFLCRNYCPVVSCVFCGRKK